MGLRPLHACRTRDTYKHVCSCTPGHINLLTHPNAPHRPEGRGIGARSYLHFRVCHEVNPDTGQLPLLQASLSSQQITCIRMISPNKARETTYEHP
jgi:hypothetical protein